MAMGKQKDEEARKIQFSGKSSYVLALPKKWVEEMGLRPGEQVVVTRQSNASLLVSPRLTSISEGKGEVTIQVSQEDSAGSIIRKLVSLYLVGFNTIHVRAKGDILTSIQRDIVKEAARTHLIGTEIVADSTNRTTLQVLLSYPQLDVENALRRMFLIATSMHKDAMLALTKLDKDSARGVMKTDDEVDRFSLYTIRLLKMAVENDRILKEVGLATARDCLGYRLIVKSIERVGDHATKIAQDILAMKVPVKQAQLRQIRLLSDFALEVLEESSLALFKRDYNAADTIVEKAKLIADMERDLFMEKGEPIEYQKIRPIVEGIKRTAEYASDIAEVVLNLTAEQIASKYKE